MTITEYLHYITVGNPVSSAIINTTSAVFSKNGKNSKNAIMENFSNRTIGNISETVTVKTVNTSLPLWKVIGRNHNIIRVAAISGSTAVILGAIGGHRFNENHEMRAIFETANRFHFFHSIVLLGMPFAKHPVWSSTLMIMGMTMFCGVLYYRAFTEKKLPPRISHLAPIGGSCLIVAWLSLLL